MMLYKLILLQFIAHLFADFIFQPQIWSDKKGKKIVSKHHFYHILVVFGFSYLFSLDYKFWFSAIILTFFHLLADILKSKLQSKKSNKSYFFLDQLIHIFFLILISMSYAHFSEINFLFDFEIKILAIAVGFVFCTKPANILIKYIFMAFSISPPEEKNATVTEKSIEEKSLPNAGKLIGIVERILALALILLGEFGAVGFIVAAKSILRFNDTQKTEYVLVGTLLSFGIAVLIGMAISFV